MEEQMTGSQKVNEIVQDNECGVLDLVEIPMESDSQNSKTPTQNTLSDTVSGKNDVSLGTLALMVLLLSSLLPDLLCSVFMISRGIYLSAGFVLATQNICVLLAVLALLFVLKKKKKEVKSIGMVASLFWLSSNALHVVKSLVVRVILQNASVLELYLPTIICVVLEVLLLEICLCAVISGKSLPASLKCSFREFGIRIVTYAVLLLSLTILQINDLSGAVFGRNLVFETPMQSISFHMILVAVTASGFALAGLLLSRSIKRTESTSAKKSWLVISCILFLTGSLLNVLNTNINTISDADRYSAEFAQEAAYGVEYMAKGNYSSASSSLHKAYEEKEMLRAIVYDENVQDVYSLYSRNPRVFALYCMATKSAKKVESRYLTKKVKDIELNQLLLHQYSLDVENGKENGTFARDVASYLAANRIYTVELGNVSELSVENKDKLKLTLTQYEKLDPIIKALDVIDLYQKTGEYPDYEIILDLADEYPDHKEVQYLAATYMKACARDGMLVSAKERTGQCVDRMIALYKEDTSVSQESVNAIKKYALDLYCSVSQYEKAWELVDSLTYVSETDRIYIEVKKMEILDKLGKDEELFALVKELLSQGVSSEQVHYYACIGAAKNKDYDLALDSFINLCDYRLQPDFTSDKLVRWENMVFVLAEYITMWDTSAWTDFQIDFYRDLSEEQRAYLSKNSFADHYLAAVYYTFNERKHDKAVSHCDALLKENDQLAMIHYLKGCNYFATEEFSSAISSFRNACSLYVNNPTLLYSLANALDANEEYLEAYEICCKVESMMNDDVNHQKDWYGIAYHNPNLRKDLEVKLREEGLLG